MNQIEYIMKSAQKPVRLVQCIQCVNEENLIETCLESIYDEVDEIIVIEGAVLNYPDRTEDGHSTDNTVDVIQTFLKERDPGSKIRFIQKNRPFVNLEEIKNTFHFYLNDGDIRIVADVDEIYEKEDIKKLRELCYIYPDAIEFVPNFLHFYRDLHNIRIPDGEFQPQHQRITKHREGYHHRHHPILTAPEGYCTYFTQEIQRYRYLVPKMFIWHLGFTKDAAVQRRKAEFYKKELANTGDKGSEAHDLKTQEFLEQKEDLSLIASYNGHYPKCLEKFLFEKDEFYSNKKFVNWKEVEPYRLEKMSQCWVMTKAGKWNNSGNQIGQELWK